jgi:hypothetical protein
MAVTFEMTLLNATWLATKELILPDVGTLARMAFHGLERGFTSDRWWRG